MKCSRCHLPRHNCNKRYLYLMHRLLSVQINLQFRWLNLINQRKTIVWSHSLSAKLKSTSIRTCRKLCLKWMSPLLVSSNQVLESLSLTRQIDSAETLSRREGSWIQDRSVYLNLNRRLNRLMLASWAKALRKAVFLVRDSRSWSHSTSRTLAPWQSQKVAL